MITADWLLKNHQRHISFAKMLEVQIQHFVATPIQDTDTDGFIEELMMDGKSLDGLPHAVRCGSRTEEVAITYRERMEAEQAQNVQMLQQQLCQIRYYVRLYDAVAAGLDPTEKWIVESHYLQSLSLNEMICIASDTLNNVSKSTLCRKKKELLSKIDHYLQIVQASVSEKKTESLRLSRNEPSHIKNEFASPNLLPDNRISKY